jgi:hypothetical protein
MAASGITVASDFALALVSQFLVLLGFNISNDAGASRFTVVE